MLMTDPTFIRSVPSNLLCKQDFVAWNGTRLCPINSHHYKCKLLPFNSKESTTEEQRSRLRGQYFSFIKDNWSFCFIFINLLNSFFLLLSSSYNFSLSSYDKSVLSNIKSKIVNTSSRRSLRPVVPVNSRRKIVWRRPQWKRMFSHFEARTAGNTSYEYKKIKWNKIIQTFVDVCWFVFAKSYSHIIGLRKYKSTHVDKGLNHSISLNFLILVTSVSHR